MVSYDEISLLYLLHEQSYNNFALYQKLFDVFGAYIPSFSIVAQLIHSYFAHTEMLDFWMCKHQSACAGMWFHRTVFGKSYAYGTEVKYLVNKEIQTLIG